MLPFILAQIVGAALGAAMVTALYPDASAAAGAVVVPPDPASSASSTAPAAPTARTTR